MSDEKTQIDKFRDASRELGCDESEEHFDAALKSIAKAPTAKNGKPGDHDKAARK